MTQANPKPKAIVVDDDRDARDLIDRILTRMGFEVIGVSLGSDAVEAVQDHDPRLVTVDLNLPGMDGFETTRRIRAISSCYVMVVSAREEELDILEGLGLGADDYVTKPFHPRVLRARVEAMLRRPRAGAIDSVSEQPALQASSGGGEPLRDPLLGQFPDPARLLLHNGLILDPVDRVVMLDGSDVRLTRHEYELLRALMFAGRKVLSKAELGEMLRREDPASAANARVIEAHIANLRKKLGESLNHPRIVETVWRVGYRLTARDEAFS